VKTKKLKLSQILEQVIATIEQQSISLLAVKSSHVLTVLDLPIEHRDTFDRSIDY
jgi:PIN domain nuclease of toxin-antitoxin system